MFKEVITTFKNTSVPKRKTVENKCSVPKRKSFKEVKTTFENDFCT